MQRRVSVKRSCEGLDAGISRKCRELKGCEPEHDACSTDSETRLQVSLLAC